MMTKRDFLVGAAAVTVTAATVVSSTTATATAAATAGGAAGPADRVGWAAQVHDVDLVIYNERHAAARAFAQVHVDRGIPALPLQGDAGVLWYSTVRAQVRAGTRRIAGVGTHTDQFIVQTLAREAGLKVRSTTRIEGSHEGPGLVSWTMGEVSNVP